MEGKTVRIFIAEDVEFVRMGLKLMIEQYAKKGGLNWQIVGEAATRDKAIEGIEKEKPDIALIDLEMPNNDGDAVRKKQNKDAGFEIIENIKKEKLRTKTIVLTTNDTAASVRRAFKLGIDGFVVKSRNDDVRTAISRVLQGDTHIDPTQSGKLKQAFVVEPLSEREKEVLLWTAVGLSQKQIAGRLQKLKKGHSDSEEGTVSERTVQAHMKKIYGKLGLDVSGRATTAGAIETARSLGFISDTMIEELIRKYDKESEDKEQ